MCNHQEGGREGDIPESDSEHSAVETHHLLKKAGEEGVSTPNTFWLPMTATAVPETGELAHHYDNGTSRRACNYSIRNSIVCSRD